MPHGMCPVLRGPVNAATHRLNRVLNNLQTMSHMTLQYNPNLPHHLTLQSHYHHLIIPRLLIQTSLGNPISASFNFPHTTFSKTTAPYAILSSNRPHTFPHAVPGAPVILSLETSHHNASVFPSLFSMSHNPIHTRFSFLVFTHMHHLSPRHLTKPAYT